MADPAPSHPHESWPDYAEHDPVVIEEMHFTGSALFREMVEKLASRPGDRFTYSELDDELDWPRQRSSSVFGGFKSARGIESKRPFHLCRPADSPRKAWEIWMDEGQAAVIANLSSAVVARDTDDRPGPSAVVWPDSVDVQLRNVRQIGSFAYKWPELEEEFSVGWEAELAAKGDASARLRHGITGRDAYGERRARTVTFLDGAPMVEGVGTDDYGRTRALVSLIKPWRGHRLAKKPSDVPNAYQDFEIVEHRSEIRAPYSKRCLAVKIPEDDLQSWAAVAWLRKAAKDG